MRIDENDGDPDKEADFYLLKNTKCPAVLTENLFMDTWEDCKILLSKEGKDRIIDLHVKGILEYIRLNKLV
jgi:N-acetylmuramoyl-L-alanine amidase